RAVGNAPRPPEGRFVARIAGGRNNENPSAQGIRRSAGYPATAGGIVECGDAIVWRLGRNEVVVVPAERVTGDPGARANRSRVLIRGTEMIPCVRPDARRRGDALVQGVTVRSGRRVAVADHDAGNEGRMHGGVVRA